VLQNHESFPPEMSTMLDLFTSVTERLPLDKPYAHAIRLSGIRDDRMRYP